MAVAADFHRDFLTHEHNCPWKNGCMRSSRCVYSFVTILYTRFRGISRGTAFFVI